ncbi:MAG: sensor histidine kinase [Pseudorhodoplanes sp.]
MTELRRIVFALFAVATLALAVAGSFLTFPEPSGVIVIDRATLRTSDGQSRTVTLPPQPTDRRAESPSQPVTYVVDLVLTQVQDEPLFLLVPATSQGFSLSLNGEPIFKTDIHTLWSEPMIRSSSLVQLPQHSLHAGHNELSFVLSPGTAVLPNYLGKLYVGSEAALSANFRLRIFFEEDLKTMSLVAQALLGIGILIAYLYRPGDPIFSWLAAPTLLAFVLTAALISGIDPDFRFVRAYIVSLTPAIGILAIGFALALVGRQPPRIITHLSIAVPALLCLVLFARLLATNTVVLIDVAVLIVTFTVAAAIIAWAALRHRNVDAAIMLLPILLLCWFLARDAALIFGWRDDSILIASYVRPLILLAILAVLMRRLTESLDRLDHANETLQHRLAEREAELAVLHRKDRLEATRLVQEQERQRLTRDLHDGISGHLVSIIAMAEKTEGEAKPIEQTARRALDDLRLVIYSLDLDDRELPLALASFRERLVPQLRRMGVELDWSMTGLPEIGGVTPGNALMVLRIMQEAVTNALNHGSAHTIIVRGAESTDEMAVISIENIGKPFVAAATGHGIANMRERARHLQGRLDIEPIESGTRVSLTLPRRLPSQQDGAEPEGRGAVR